jgi:two-component system phosphate regulon sensor histidine kinase PhoR
MAVLMFDITQQQNSEINRRAFTSIVTHELKTPLTSIIGYAEIMQDGLAKPDDMQTFAGRIYDEAKRLIAMIEDILRLSKLDEEQTLPPNESVALKSLCQSVVRRLSHTAEAASVSLKVDGDESEVMGSASQLEEMVYNLVDNAIRYNRKGGSVLATISKSNGQTILKVRDTGIGIPKNAKAKVFERFYRVDGSHSKTIEGTGLGLSIVKHIARRHNALIELESEENVGTEIRVLFNSFERL